MTVPTARDMRMPQPSAFSARSKRPAPAFWATKADMDCMKADGTSMMKAQTFSATPTPAEGTTPRALTMAWMIRNEIPTRRSWVAMGRPRRVMRAMISPRKRIWSLRRVKGRSPRFIFLPSMRREIRTLTAWAPTVAMAAPTVPMWKTATRSRSPAMLQTQAMATVIRGVTESPIPRKMLPMRL